MKIRELRPDETELLKDFLYEAIFIPEGVKAPEKNIIELPELKVYYEDFGKGAADHCLVAEEDERVVGAVWTRIMKDYGHMDDETPSFAISLYKEYRGRGIGTELMLNMLEVLRKKGYRQASLAVQKANYAVRMYEKVGFYVADQNEEEYIMVCELRRNIMTRPDFDDIKSYEEFLKYYWYREELIKICRARGLKADGSKIELNKVIEAYFSGEKILPEKKIPVKRKKSVVTELTRDTGLIECAFTFGPRFRDFFRKETGEENFRFNVDMVATAKAVKEKGDESFTLGDLLDIYYGKQTYATYDKSALQWNKFVHDFCEDEATKVYPERLKAAAALWKIVRESDREKKYSHELLEEFRDMIR